MQRMLFPLAALGLAALVALGARCVQSSESDTASQVGASPEAPVVLPTNFPTPGALPPWLSIANGVARNPGQAAGFAREILESASPPFIGTARPDSFVYVETSVGQARGLLDPDGGMTWKITDDNAPAVVFLATGEFEMTPPVALNLPVYTVTRVWFMIPLGQRGEEWSPIYQDIDLSRLGEVDEVPLPLAPFPTPVSLGTPEADAQ